MPPVQQEHVDVVLLLTTDDHLGKMTVQHVHSGEDYCDGEKNEEQPWLLVAVVA